LTYHSLPLLLFLQTSHAPRVLHSFPTRRSSDLSSIPPSSSFCLRFPIHRRRNPPDRLHHLAELLMRDRLRAVRQRMLRIIVHFEDRKSTRLNSSHGSISYAVFCLKKKKQILNHN